MIDTGALSLEVARDLLDGPRAVFKVAAVNETDQPVAMSLSATAAGSPLLCRVEPWDTVYVRAGGYVTFDVHVAPRRGAAAGSYEIAIQGMIVDASPDALRLRRLLRFQYRPSLEAERRSQALGVAGAVLVGAAVLGSLVAARDAGQRVASSPGVPTPGASSTSASTGPGHSVYFLGVQKGSAASFVDLRATTANGAHGTLSYYDSAGLASSQAFTLTQSATQTVALAKVSGLNGSVGVALDADSDVVGQLRVQRSGREGIVESGVPMAAKLLYFVDGYTGFGFGEKILLLNPSAHTAHVSFQLTTATRQVTPPAVDVAPYSVRALDLSLFHVNLGVSVRLTSDQGIVAARAMTFSRDAQGAGYGYTLASGATAAATSWKLAAPVLTPVGRVQTYLSLYNPGASRAAVVVHRATASGEILKTVTLAAHARASVRLLDGMTRPIVVVSAVPIVAERAAYAGSPTAPRVTGLFGVGTPLKTASAGSASP